MSRSKKAERFLNVCLGSAGENIMIACSENQQYSKGTGTGPRTVPVGQYSYHRRMSEYVYVVQKPVNDW